ncbi:MAG TPA: class I SAM-dependent methyltransferase [Rhodopila sp.]|nr:class I SAM-dependent methyltransferase [Rhodopila sp.]
MDLETFPVLGSNRAALERAVVQAWPSLGCEAPPGATAFGFFRALAPVLAAQSGPGAPRLVAAVMHHVEYLASKAGCLPAAVLNGDPFSAGPQVVIDAVANIAALLREFRPTAPLADSMGLPAEVARLILEAERRLEGWCSRQKAVCLAELVLAERPLVAVEIGVFGGRSLVPIAAALRHNGAGAIYGIEAWSPAVAVENTINDEHDSWWTTVEFDRIKHEFCQFVADTKLTSQVRIIEAPSVRAAGVFDTIDFLHIDGSHSILNAAEDVILYARKVRPGGIVVFDDVDWDSTTLARGLLDYLCEPAQMLTDAETGKALCAVLRRRGGAAAC